MSQDRKKTIEGLFDAIGIIHGYIPKRYWGDGEQACRNAIALLKEQEVKIEQLNRFVNGFSRDAMPVVRCADCKYCVKEPNGELYCDILAVGYEPLGSKKVNSDWFCADGERRDDDD